jgi:hypothetical protein
VDGAVREATTADGVVIEVGEVVGKAEVGVGAVVDERGGVRRVKQQGRDDEAHTHMGDLRRWGKTITGLGGEMLILATP